MAIAIDNHHHRYCPPSLALFVIPYSIQPRDPGRCGTDPARFKLLFISRPPSSHIHTSLTSKQQRLRQREKHIHRHQTHDTHDASQRNAKDADKHTHTHTPTPTAHSSLSSIFAGACLLAAPTSWPGRRLWTIRYSSHPHINTQRTTPHRQSRHLLPYSAFACTHPSPSICSIYNSSVAVLANISEEQLYLQYSPKNKKQKAVAGSRLNWTRPPCASAFCIRVRIRIHPYQVDSYDMTGGLPALD